MAEQECNGDYAAYQMHHGFRSLAHKSHKPVQWHGKGSGVTSVPLIPDGKALANITTLLESSNGISNK